MSGRLFSSLSWTDVYTAAPDLMQPLMQSKASPLGAWRQV
jgi:hypothetical protein